MIRALRPLGIAVAWIALYVIVGGGVWFALTQSVVLVTNHYGLALPDLTSPWFLPVFVPEFTIGLGVATWLVGVRLARHSWAELGWRVLPPGRPHTTA